MAMSHPVYLDYNATTPTDSRVVAAMLPYFTEKFGNAASRSHVFGWEAADAVEHSRNKLAEILGIEPINVRFTSGATEANNLAIRGVIEASSKLQKHIITVATEHRAVLEVVENLKKYGVEVTVLSVDYQGIIDLKALDNAIRSETVLVSVMAANNETGVLQPVAEIAQLCRNRGVLFHSDCSQSFGKMATNLGEPLPDLMSITAHKVYGPKGIGALIFPRKIAINPQILGGGHERGIRSGTLNIPGIVGFAEAAYFAFQGIQEEAKRLKILRDKLEKVILSSLTNTSINGSNSPRLPHVSNIAFGGIDGELLMEQLCEIAVSNGSACSSAKIEPSHVLLAMGLSEALASASIRISLGRFTTENDIEIATNHIIKVVKKLRNE